MEQYQIYYAIDDIDYVMFRTGMNWLYDKMKSHGLSKQV